MSGRKRSGWLKVVIAVYLALAGFGVVLSTWAAFKYCEGIACLALDIAWILWGYMNLVSLPMGVWLRWRVRRVVCAEQGGLELSYVQLSRLLYWCVRLHVMACVVACMYLLWHYFVGIGS